MDASSRSRVGQALELLKSLQAAKGLHELGVKSSVVVSDLWAGPGGSAVLGRVNLSVAALRLPDWQLAALLAHELVHVRQGIRFFGDLRSEREAYVMQRRVELALLAGQGPDAESDRQQRLADLAALEGSWESARDWIRRQSPVYASFPDAPPRPWQVWRWWPQVRFAALAAWRRS